MEMGTQNKAQGKGETKAIAVLGALIAIAAVIFVFCIITAFTVSGKEKPLIDRKEALKLEEEKGGEDAALSMQMEDIMIKDGGSASGEDGQTQTEVSWKDADYAIEGSDSRILSEDELSGMSKEQLKYARNEILARHGRIFNDPELSKHFESKSWYQGTVEPETFDANMDDRINEIELANIELIKTFE